MDATIRLREGQLRKFRAMANLTQDTALAARMGVNRQTVYRTVTQKNGVGLSEKFIAALLSAFPHLQFDDLFEVVTAKDDESEDAA